MSDRPRPGMAVPEGRQMPNAERLTPPAWERGRTTPPNGDKISSGSPPRQATIPSQSSDFVISKTR